MDALVFHAPDVRGLISGDALWRNGFGILFADVIGAGGGIEAARATLEAIGRAAAKTLTAGDYAIIVLARPDTPQPQGVCLPDVRFAALNLARLEAAGDPAKLERRIGQEGLRVLAMLLDMSMCPFPLCVLTGYEKTEDLDQMSGSYCPPCMERFDRVAREAGIRMVGAPGQAPAAAETPAAVEAVPAAAPEAPAAAPEAAPEHPEQPISLPFPAG